MLRPPPSKGGPLFWGAIIGAVVGALIEGVAQKLRGEELDWGRIGRAAAVGAVTGMLGGAVTGALLRGTTATGGRLVGQRAAAGYLGGTTAGGADRVINNALDGKPLLDDVGEAMLIGGTVGAVAAPLAGPVQRVTQRTIDAFRGGARRATTSGNGGRQVAQAVDDVLDAQPPALPPPQPLKSAALEPTPFAGQPTPFAGQPTPVAGHTTRGRNRGLAQALGAEDGPPLPSTGGVRLAPIANESVVVDSNIAIALERQHLGRALQAGEQRFLQRIRQLGTGDVRLADRSVKEIQERATQNYMTNSFRTTVPRTSPEYLAIQRRLEAMNLGGAKGAPDRSIVTDLFFADVEPGVVPRFLSGDKNVYNKLAQLAGIDPAKVGRPIADAFPDGFPVTIDGRTIHVLPVR